MRKNDELLRRLYEDFDYRMVVYLRRKNGKGFSGYGEFALFRVDNYKNNCQVGNFGLNFWFRTKKGMDGERYSSLNHMINAIKQTAKKYGLELSGTRIYIEKGVNKRVICEEEYVDGCFEENERWIFEL